MATSPSSADRARLAGQHLERAREAAARDAFAETVIWACWAAEVAVTALAQSRGIDTQASHLRRASIARRLHEEGVVSQDLGSLLIRLNTERKRVVYDGREPDLRGRTWHDMLRAVAGLVDAAQADDRIVGPPDT